MSFSTFSDVQPTIVDATAVPAPMTFTKSRRLTPDAGASELIPALRFSFSIYCSSVVACRTVVARLERRVGSADVAVDAPTHVQRVLLVDLLHVLDLPVTRLARNACIHVSHVGEVHVFRELMNAHPRNWLLLVVVSGEERCTGFTR